MASRTFVYLKTVAPTTGDDTNDGYKVGDEWLDTVADLMYKAIDVTAGAAIWVELVGAATTQTLTNKTIGNTNTVTLKDNLFTLQDPADTTKQAVFRAVGITAGQTRAFSLPDSSGTLVITTTAQTLSGKTLTTPTIADFTNANHDHGDADDGGALVAAAVGLTTQGDILYRDGSGLARLAAGTSGQALRTGGAGANPAWGEGGYQVVVSQNNLSPADATTYYFGAGTFAAITTADVRRAYIPRAGTITRVDLFVYNNAGTQGTNETSTISLRLNNTTDTTLTSSFDVNDASGASSFFNVTGLSIAVAAGDYFEIKWVTPTWVTNPTAVFIEARVYIR